ncbi:hypothetical protein RUM43_010617 [Polyplax serrata]|uniref:ZP domain-containing protein n=1 Tax=Polyplax serrata TaxID=468196 RepID=A0AAN8P4H3_POLSC
MWVGPALLRFLTVAFLWSVPAAGQSNYASHGNNVEYQGEGLPEKTVLDGKVIKLDDLSPLIFLNRTKATLNCVAGSMQIELKFNEPFFGIVYADFDRNSACQIAGSGNLTYHLELPLKGCGTRQKPQRVFTNNIVVRFHPGLEMDGDEIITIVCRYPPPIAPLPAALPAPILEPVAPVPLKPPLAGYQILMIICAILFLSLLLLGLGCSYYCLKNRRVRVVHKPFSTIGTGSEITKLSGSSLGNISMFEGLKIPRAHAPPLTATASSSEALIPSEHSDTLPSDYPSESPSSAHSEVEDVDTRSLAESVHEVVVPVPEPKFDVQVKVKRSPPPPPPITPSDSDVESVMTTQARNLTKILEKQDIPKQKTTFSFVPDIHPPPKLPTPMYSTVVKKDQKTEVVRDLTSSPIRSVPVKSINTETTDIQRSDVTEIRKKVAPPPPSILPYKTETTETQQTSELIEPPLVISRRPEITSHVVDDVFLRTITEKKTIEDIERHKRLVTEYHPKPVPNKWDVTIRNYPAPGQEMPRDLTSDWDTYSETSTSTQQPSPPPERRTTHRIDRTYTSKLDIPPPPQPPVQNWDILTRVLEPTYPEDDGPNEQPPVNTLTTIDREKWRKIITTESTLRTLLTEATVKEDYERISRDERYETLFEPNKWEVIIRILAPERVPYDKNGQPTNPRYKKKPDWDNRSRRSSLPTLYEYDSDGSSYVTLPPDLPTPSTVYPDFRRPSFRSDRTDVRSMTEVMVDYTKQDTLSDVSSRPSSYFRRPYYDEDEPDYGYTRGSMIRSVSQPSLARSASEFTEHWTTTRKWDQDTDPSSPEHSPKSVRSGRTSIAGSTVSTQRRRQAIINKTLGTAPSGLSRSSESILEPNEAITPFMRRDAEIFSTPYSALSKSDGRLDDMPTFPSQPQEVLYTRSMRTSTETIKQTTKQTGWR